MTEWFRALRFLVPSYAFLTVFFVLILVGTEGSPDFYRAASSIIPTLLLTLAVAGRFFLLSPLPATSYPSEEFLSNIEKARSTMETARRDPSFFTKEQLGEMLDVLGRTSSYVEHRREVAERKHHLWTRLFAGGLLLLLGAGEAAALGAIASETESPILFATACGAMAAGFAGVAFVALAGPLPEEPSADKPESQ
jgi:hypothetical protein